MQHYYNKSHRMRQSQPITELHRIMWFRHVDAPTIQTKSSLIVTLWHAFSLNDFSRGSTVHQLEMYTHQFKRYEYNNIFQFTQSPILLSLYRKVSLFCYYVFLLNLISYIASRHSDWLHYNARCRIVLVFVGW